MTPFTRRTVRLSLAAIHSQGRNRPVIVELGPPGDVIGFRLKGCRQSYYLPVDWCFREAVRNEMARRRAAKKREAAEKKKARGY